MAASNDAIYKLLVDMNGRMAVFENLIPTINSMYKDIYIGNGDRPIRDEIREWRADKTAAEKDAKDCAEEKKVVKKEFWSKTNMIIIGAVITQVAIAVATYLRVEVLK